MKLLIRAIMASLTLFLLCGVIYPLGMTGISQLIFPKQANGSIVEYNGKPAGSEFLGQDLSDERFFHGRISAVNYNTYKKDRGHTSIVRFEECPLLNTEDIKDRGHTSNVRFEECPLLNPDENGKTVYAGVGSGSANLAPSNPVLVDRVKKDMDEFLKAHPDVKREDIPADLLTSSGSGLDPHISPEAAEIQIPAISKATGISVSDLKKLVAKYTEGRVLGIFGEPRVNILKANLEIASRSK